MARAQQGRITAEVALSSSRTAAEAEANTLRQQLLQALQKACDAELRASNLQQDKDSSAAQQQVRVDIIMKYVLRHASMSHKPKKRMPHADF